MSALRTILITVFRYDRCGGYALVRLPNRQRSTFVDRPNVERPVTSGRAVWRLQDFLRANHDNNLFEVVDWTAAGVQITSEKAADPGMQSIFDWLRARLVASDAGVVFCDDGSGEMADFLSIHQTAEGPRIRMYHCKASSDQNPGNRIKDLEVVCAQAIKSCVWIRPENFLERLRYRATLESVPGYHKGDEAEVIQLLTPQVQRHIQFETYIVQPGVMREGRTEPLSNLLAAARDYLADVGINFFGVIGS